jgi:hypothetical protein
MSLGISRVGRTMWTFFPPPVEVVACHSLGSVMSPPLSSLSSSITLVTHHEPCRRLKQHFFIIQHTTWTSSVHPTNA